MSKSLTATAKSILVKESDDPTPDRDAKLMTPNKATLRPGAGAVEGRFANPGAMSPGEGEYQDLGPAAVTPTDVPPSAKAAGATKKDTSKSSQAAVPAEPSMMEEDIEISEELEAFINQMMEEGYSEDEISEAIAENFEIVEEKDDEEDDEEDDDDDEEDKLNELSIPKLRAAAGEAEMRAADNFAKVYTDRGPDGAGNKGNANLASHYARMAQDFKNVADKRSGLAKGPSAAAKRSAMKEHVDALLAGENLSEDFRAKAETLFESAVSLRVNEEVAVLEEAYEKALEEEVSTILDNLSEQVDAYLGYVVEQWMQENEIAIEAGLRTEITEEFISGLKNLFAESYIEIPEEKFQVTEELGNKVAELENRLNEEIEKNIGLSKNLVESKKFEVFVSACEGLTDTQAEKLRSLTETVDVSSVEEFEKKVSVLKENYFPQGARNTSTPLDPTEDNGSGSGKILTESLNGPMSAYVKTLDRSLSKKKE